MFLYVKLTNNYYQNTKGSFKKKHAKESSFWRRKRKGKKDPRKISNLTEEEKEKRCQYHCKSNKNLSEEQKQKLFVYMRNHYLAHKRTAV